jgi:ferric-dicitrate binding protein FerR (iron transport regulator)
MDQERFHYLTDGYLADRLTEAESAELLRALTEQAELRGQLRAQVSMERLLERRLGARPNPMTLQVMAALRDPMQKAGVVTSIMRDLDRAALLAPLGANRLGASTIGAPVFFPTCKHRTRFFFAASAAAMLLLVGGASALILMHAHNGGGAAVVITQDENRATVKLVEGHVTVRRGGAIQAVTPGFALHALDVLETDDGSATLDYPDGTQVRVYKGSQVTLHPAELKDLAHIGVGLQSGRIEAAVKPQPMGRPMMVVTPQARATILGTRFELTVTAGESKLVVTEGAINFANTAQNEAVVVAKDHSAVAAANVRLDAVPLTRDPAYWPFSAGSPWNMALGSSAAYAPVASPHFDASKGIDFLTDASSVPVAIGAPEDPERTLVNRTPGRTGTVTLRLPRTIRVESGEYHTLVCIDERHARAVELLGAEVHPDGPVAANLAMRIPLQGSGLFDEGVPHGLRLSGGTGLAGLLRRGELKQGIRHALAASVNLAALNAHGPNGQSHVWPARRRVRDPEGLSGATGNLFMGSLLALPPGVALSELDVGTSGPAYEIAKALQDYGVYLIDRQGESPRDLRLYCEYGMGDEIPPELAGSLAKVMARLQVVTNNAEDSVGGGGIPRRAPAPPFAPEFAEQDNLKADERF